MNVLVLIWVVLACTGFFCVGYLFGNRKVLYWRIKWIETEHDLARAQGRKPRNISDIENKITRRLRWLRRLRQGR